MSFLKTDGLYFEDEDVDEELEDEETDESVSSSPESGGEDPDGNDNEETGTDGDPEDELDKKAQNKIEKNSIKEILKKALMRFFPRFTSQEKLFFEKMKKKGHAKEVATAESAMELRKNATKITSTGVGTTVGVSGSWIVFIIAIVVIVAIVIFSIIGLSADEPTKSEVGIKGDKFYGARVVYRDDDLASNSLVEQYVDVFETAVENLQAQTFTEIVDVGGEDKTYEVKLTINLTLPEEDLNYEDLDLVTFATDYPQLFNIVGDIAKLSYKIDNDVANEADIPTELADILNGIKYFGFNKEMIGESIVDEDANVDNNIIEIVYDALKSSGAVTIKERLNGSTDEFAAATNVTIENIDDNIREKVISSINVDENKIRTEKLFIKDLILEDEDSIIEGIELKDYKAFIYLPKQDVECDFLSYMVVTKENANFDVKLINNGEEINLTRGDAEHPYDDKSYVSYKFDSSNNLNENMNATECVDVSNLNKFTKDSSLVRIFTDKEVDYNIYLEEITLENGDTILTYKKGSTCLLFESDDKFKFTNEIG